MNIEAILNSLKGKDILIEEYGTITHSDIMIYKFDWRCYSYDDNKERIVFKSKANECDCIDYITFDSGAVKEIKETSYDIFEIEFNHGQSIILTEI